MPVPSARKQKGTRRSSKSYKAELDAQLGPIRGSPRQCRGCGKVLSTVCNRSRHEWTEHMPKVSCPYKKYGCRAEMGRRMDYTHKHCQVCPYNPNRAEAASDNYDENSPTVQASMVATPNIVTPETSPESSSTPLDNSAFTPNFEMPLSYDVPLLSTGWSKSSNDSTPIDTPENGYMGTGLVTGSAPSKPDDDFDSISLFELPPGIMEGLTGGEDGSLDESENFDFLMK